jgi:hypothetical protein
MTNGSGKHEGPAGKKKSAAKASKAKDSRIASLKRKNLLPNGIATGKGR